MAGIERRRPVASRGGRPVHRRFWFAPADGGKYPSESVHVRGEVLESPDFGSWIAALDYMKQSVTPIWLVIPIDQKDEIHDRNVARSSVWRTAKRNGIHITSEYVAPYLYIALTD